MLTLLQSIGSNIPTSLGFAFVYLFVEEFAVKGREKSDLDLEFSTAVTTPRFVHKHRGERETMDYAHMKFLNDKSLATGLLTSIFPYQLYVSLQIAISFFSKHTRKSSSQCWLWRRNRSTLDEHHLLFDVTVFIVFRHRGATRGVGLLVL